VAGLRQTHGIAAFQPNAATEDTLTLAQAADALGVSPTAIRRLIGSKVLPAEQPLPHVPWAIRRLDLYIEAGQRAIAAVKSGRSGPRIQPLGQLTLVKSST
jgi:hypothetical protein